MKSERRNTPMEETERREAICRELASMSPPVIPDTVFPAGEHGVRPFDAGAVHALNRAIQKCHDAGGGRVVVSAGEYWMHGPVRLLSRVNLHLEDGAVLKFSGNPKDFLPVVFQRWEGTEVYSHSPLVTADSASDIALTGRGILDGGGSLHFASWQAMQSSDQNRLRSHGAQGVPVAERIFGSGTVLRPAFFQPLRCERVLVEGVTFRDSPFWVIQPTYCRKVQIRGVTVASYNHNNDGCDPDSCEDVLIEDCDFRTGDDSIAIKSGRDEDGWRVGLPTQRVFIRNCRLLSRINGVCIGSEMSGGVRDVFVENCTVKEAASVLYLKGNADRGGFVEDVHLKNIRVESAREALIRFEANYHSHRGGNKPPAFRRVRIENVECQKAEKYGVFIAGDPALPVRDVELTDLRIAHAKVSHMLRNFEDVSYRGVWINGEEMPENPQSVEGESPLMDLVM